ncbi:MAG: hypothetical protein J4G10_00985 [Alphaproteobacteria bacterium]|nr:hypothetical protein [Alphaproteobacteria bacterium]
MVEPVAATPLPTPTASARGEGGFSLWDKDGFSFGDLLDAVNPLQHLPVVGSLYREWTGDHIGAAARLAGGVLFAGIPGLIGSAVNTAFEAVTGKDIGETVLAYFSDDNAKPIAIAARQAPETGFGSSLDLALLAGMQESALEKEEDASTTFALRFDRQLHAYEKGHNLTLPDTPSLRLNA